MIQSRFKLDIKCYRIFYKQRGSSDLQEISRGFRERSLKSDLDISPGSSIYVEDVRYALFIVYLMIYHSSERPSIGMEHLQSLINKPAVKPAVVVHNPTSLAGAAGAVVTGSTSTEESKKSTYTPYVPKEKTLTIKKQ